MTRKERESAQWNTSYEAEVLKLQPGWAGRICWDTASHLRNLGHTPVQAARMYTYDSSQEAGPRDRNAIELP